MTEPMVDDRATSVHVVEMKVELVEASSAPFNLIFVGPMWSEADLLGLAFAYESATHHRRAPALRVG